MGHREVLEYLANQRNNGNEEFITKKSIKENIKFGHVDRDLRKLWKYGLIETKTDFFGKCSGYRAKDKYI